jgi:toxin-antitoxin system PIN domain toxin
VTLADTNFWLALTLSRHVFHPAARDWFASQSAPSAVLFCRATQQSLLRLLTTEAVTRPYGVEPMSNGQAWEVYHGLRTERRVGWAAEPDPAAVDARWKSLAAGDTPSPKLWMDAYLAAFALVANHGFVTTDRAFTQFSDLDATILPLR